MSIHDKLTCVLEAILKIVCTVPVAFGRAQAVQQDRATTRAVLAKFKTHRWQLQRKLHVHITYQITA